MQEFDDPESDYELIRSENESIIAAFDAWLHDKGLSEATVKKHNANIDFYVNEFLQYSEPKHACDGVEEVSYFLGYWFIRKAMWASESSIRSNAASFKKFYTFMLERGEVSEEEVQDLKLTIKEELPE
jgi:site-specific recombinase XerD